MQTNGATTVVNKMAREGRAQSMPILYTRGSHFDVGHATGSAFADRIRCYMQDDETASNTVRKFYESREGRQVCDVLRRKGEDDFPQYAAEIRGLAAGVGMSYEDMFIHNLAFDILYGHLPAGMPPDIDPLVSSQLQERCSTVLLNRPEIKVIGHNEDSKAGLHLYAYMLSAVVDDPDFLSTVHGISGDDNPPKDVPEDADASSRLEAFTAYCYPGILPGVAFSFNSHGLVFSVNSQLVDSAPCGTPSACIARSLLGAASVEQCRHLLENSRGGGGNVGFSVNIADMKFPDVLWSAEVQPGLHGNNVYMHPVVEAKPGDLEDKGCYFQTNVYQHLSNSRKFSSLLRRPLARSSRAKELLPYVDERDVLRVLGDTQSEDEFFIFRRASSSDTGDTAATALFDIKGKRLDVYLDNPSSSLPLMSLPLQCAL